MDLVNKRILVTGAGGFIGSHLVERLVELGGRVRAFVRYNSMNNWGWIDTFPKERKDKIEIFCGDIREARSVDKAMKGIDVVFHLAALVAIPYSYISPSSFVRTNVEGTLNILQAALDNDLERLIHTSTSEVYGTAKYVPIDERHPLQPQSPYSASKISGDMLAESFYRSFGLPIAIIRPFNTYGPRQSARAIIPTIITQALNRDVVELGSLHPTRDLTYVEDTVDGFIKIAESPNSIGEVINIGSKSEISIKDLAKRICEILGRKPSLSIKDERIRPKNSEVERLLAENKKAKELIGWEPKYTLDEGLEKTVIWFKENLSLYKPEIYNL
ncbi:MAG: NAD-dependent 4,6-dehydratase LegB [bacterium]|nr:NAD-dependent 4,6-dehydratase LegB [bacterium]